MNPKISQAIADLDAQRHTPTPVLQIANAYKPTLAEWPDVVRAINAAGYDVVEEPNWNKRDEFFCQCRRRTTL